MKIANQLVSNEQGIYNHDLDGFGCMQGKALTDFPHILVVEC